MQALALAARDREAPEHAQQAVEFMPDRQSHRRRLVAERRDRRSERGAQQDRHPAEVDPQQEDRHEGGFLVDLGVGAETAQVQADRSEEQTSELQSLMRISYAVFCLKKK